MMRVTGSAKFFLYLFLAFCAFTSKGQGIDIKLLQAFNGPASPSDAHWKEFSNSFKYVAVATPAVVILTGLTTHDKELTKKGLEIAGAIIISQGVSSALKYSINRQRPFDAYPDLIYNHSDPTDPSFPSGHTSVAFATATSLSMAFPKWYVIVPSFGYATAMGYSRLRLGVHYPSDVLAGAVIGVGSSIFSFKLQKLLNKKRDKVTYPTNP